MPAKSCFRAKIYFFILSTEIARIGDGKKIVSLEYIAEEQLIMVIAGRQRQVKLVPVRALGGDDVEWIKVSGDTIELGNCGIHPRKYYSRILVL